MRLILFVAVASVLAAGCFSEAGQKAPVKQPVLPPVPFTSVETVISATDSGGEPSLGVTPRGELFTDLFDTVYGSMDGGKSWTSVGNPGQPVPDLDPDLAVDQDGVVWESRLWLGCVEVAVSHDLGKTWSSNPAACPGAGGDRQYVVPTKDGTAYLYMHQLPSFYQVAIKTTDYGRTWLPTGPVEFPDHILLANGGSGWGGGGFWNAKTGSIFFTFTYSQNPGMDTQSGGPYAGYAVSRDGGMSWQVGRAGTLEGAQMGLGLVTGAADDAGNVYITWAEAMGSNGDDIRVYLATSTDDGRTWSDKIRVDDGTGSKVFPVVAAGAAGHVAIAYYEGSKAAYPDQMDGTWNVTLAWAGDVFANATFQHGRMTSTPVKEGPICISGTTCTGNRQFADYFDAVRMPDGRVGVTYNLLKGGKGALQNGFAMTTADLLDPMPK